MLWIICFYIDFHSLFCWVVKWKLYCTVSISGEKYSNGAVSHFSSMFPNPTDGHRRALLSFEFCLPESVSSHHTTLIQHFQHCQYSSPLCNGVLENVCQDRNQTARIYPNYLWFVCQDCTRRLCLFLPSGHRVGSWLCLFGHGKFLPVLFSSWHQLQMENRLHLYRAVLVYQPLKGFIIHVTFHHSHTHSNTDGRGCHARCQPCWQFCLTHLTQTCVVLAQWQGVQVSLIPYICRDLKGSSLCEIEWWILLQA